MKTNFKIAGIMLLGLFLITTACQKEKQYDNADAYVTDLQQTLDFVTSDQLKMKIDSMELFYLVDVREQTEHAYGYIPSSINICGGSLIFKVGNEDFWEQAMLYAPLKEDEIIVYCKKGKRSVLAADNLRKLGYSNVKFLDGGWKGWELTYPLEYEKNLDLLGGHAEVEETGGC